MNTTEQLHPKQILYEDNHLIIINKLPSQIVQGDKTRDTPLSELVKSYLKIKYNKPGAVFLGVIHRLDRPASGVVVFARTGKALSRMNQLFRDNEIQKKYWVVVKNKPPKLSDTLVNYLIKNQKKNKSFVTEPNRPGSKKAVLNYKYLRSADNYHLLEIELITGRHHQIRAQLAHIGCPIKGDIKYGFNTTNKNASIHLHARFISFLHPIKNVNIDLEADLPKDKLWHFFQNK